MKRRDEVLVGILLTVALAIGILGTIWLVRGGFSSGYLLYARFKWGAGVQQGQPVRLAGVKVGYVADAELETRGTIIVTLSIEDGRQIPEGTTAIVQPVGFFGDQQIALIPPERMTAGSIPENDTILSGTPAPGVPEITAKVDSIAGRMSDVAKAVQVEMVQQGGISDLRKTLAATNELVRQLSGIAAEQSRQLTLTMGQLRHTAAALDSSSIDSTVRNLQATSANVAALTSDLRRTTTRLDLVLAKIDSGGGTAGHLLNDPALYTDIRALVQHLDSLASDVKARPRRYINLRVF